ncbi:YdbH domain-containing protein [Microbulbifer sp. DLAB2-AF]|uniref:intermembrane phospholipid transport protein YdbH family protein n=1 Tax=Microbulbifer sp. DLAB2-AF TaxID=3243395 RepID=UPI00403920FD
MRKPRILIIVTTVLLATFLVGSWWKKDIVVSQMINLFAGEVVIQQLSGLKLGIKEASIEQVRLQSNRKNSLILNKVKILYPFHIIFDRDNTQKIELSIGKLTYSEIKNSTSSKPNKTEKIPSKENTLTLSNLTQNIINFIPGSVFVREIEFGGDLKAGPLKINRHNTEIHIQTPFSSVKTGNHELSLKANLTSSDITTVTEISSDLIKEPSRLEIDISKTHKNQWKLDASASSNLNSIESILNISEVLAETPVDGMRASGSILINARAFIPDEILSKANYQDILFKVESDNLGLILPIESSNKKIQAHLSTKSPIELKLKTLNPIQLESVTGSGSIEVSTLKDSGSKNLLANLRFEYSDLTPNPKFQLKGSVDLAGAEPLIKPLLTKNYFPSLEITNPKGYLSFQSEAHLNFTETSSINKNWLEQIRLAILPKSNLLFDAEITGLKEESPLLTSGLNHNHIQAEVKKNIHITGSPSESNSFNLQIHDGLIVTQLKAKNTPNSASSKIEHIQCNIKNFTECRFKFEAKSPVIIDMPAGVVLRKVDISSTIHFQEDGNIQNLKLEQVKASLGELKAKEFKIREAELIAPKVNCEILSGIKSCIIEKSSNHFSNLSSEHATLSGTLDLNNIKVISSRDSTQFSSDFSSNRLKVVTPENYTLETSLTGSLSLDGSKLEGQSQVKAGNLQLTSSLHHDIELAVGAFQFSLPYVEFNSAAPLSKVFQGLPLDIVSGGLSASGAISWPRQSTDTIDISLTNIAAIYDSSFAAGVNGNVLVETHRGKWFTSKPQPLTIESINAGLPLNNLSFSLSVNKTQDLILNDFSAEFLDGKLSSEALYWNLDNIERNSTLYAEHVSLEKLAQETESESFKAKGRLNLTIPISTGPQGITVKNGHLEAVEPGGELRYYGAFSQQMLKGNPQLKLISNALEDYDFRTLEGNLQYPPSGDLLLNLKLVGRSESMDSERDLIINLNLENNIPAMLRSLQASRDLTTALEKQLDQ